VAIGVRRRGVSPGLKTAQNIAQILSSGWPCRIGSCLHGSFLHAPSVRGFLDVMRGNDENSLTSFRLRNGAGTYFQIGTGVRRRRLSRQAGGQAILAAGKEVARL
jgi:hypothetical protein